MDTLKKAKDKYKQATTVIDLAVVLANKSLEIINAKMQSTVEQTNKDIAAGNLEKVQKNGYANLLKNYMTYCTTFNLLIGDSHSANYERKMILRTLMKGIESKSDKKSEYILLKVNAFEKHIENSILNIETLSQSIKGITKTGSVGGSVEGSSKQTKSPQKEVKETKQTDVTQTQTNTDQKQPIVKNLKDIAEVFSSMKRKIEIALSEIKLIDKTILKLIVKKGSFENISTKDYDQVHTAARNKLIKGGMDVDGKRVKQKIRMTGVTGGDQTIYIGGSALDQDLEIKAAWIGSYETDQLAMEEKPQYKNMMKKKLLNVFKVGSEDELVALAKADDETFVNKITTSSGIDAILQKQIEGILASGRLQNLLSYYIKHRNTYAPSKTELKSEAASTNEETGFVALAVKDDYINLNLSLSETSTIDEKLAYITDFVRIVMTAINKVDIQGIINKVEESFDKINEIKTNEQLSIALDNLDLLMKNIEENASLLLKRKEVKTEIFHVLDELEESEGIFQKPLQPEEPKKGGDIGISPTTDTCLYKAINFSVATLYVEVLPKVLTKRFKSKIQLNKYYDYLADKAKLPTMYKKELNIEEVTKLAVQLVDV